MITSDNSNKELSDHSTSIDDEISSIVSPEILALIPSDNHKQANRSSCRPIMFVGTGSDVGKSVINAAFCRIFLQDGYHPAPFKAQNMSLNSYAGIDGLELGRAQAVQAEACGLLPVSDMNPILLKPTSDLKAQVVLHGKPAGDQTAREYFNGGKRDELFAEVLKSYNILSVCYSPMVIEGAGSISEINLRDRDITNMRLALAVDAAVILVADIDRGGLFGSVYGTLELLPPDERRLVKGILVNKFRGDRSLFEDGVVMLEKLTGIPVVGVVPYFHDISIEEEDSVVLSLKRRDLVPDKVNVAIVLLNHLSNFTDFHLLEQISEVNLFYTQSINHILDAEIVILPGSKNTIADLIHLQETGLFEALKMRYQRGKAIMGVCGGYQMMGQAVYDPYGVEGGEASVEGLNILPVVTTLTSEKRTVQCSFYYQDTECQGYEIHMGQTKRIGGEHFVRLSDGSEEGCRISSNTWGTYLHGVFDNQVVVRELLKPYINGSLPLIVDYQSFKQQQYDRLAELVRSSCRMDLIYQMINPES